MTPQQKWDTFLFTSFYKRPEVKMQRVIEIFNQGVEGLARAPLNRQHLRSTTRVFICNCLPVPISNYLWEHDITEVYDLAIRLPKNLDTLIKPYSKFTKKERLELLSSTKAFKAANLSDRAISEMKEKHKGYSHVRGTRGVTKKIKRDPRPNTNGNLNRMNNTGKYD